MRKIIIRFFAGIVGIFYVHVLDFSGWRNPGQYFTDLTEDRLAKLLKQVPELQLCETFLTGDVRPGRQQEQWLNAIVEKR